MDAKKSQTYFKVMQELADEESEVLEHKLASTAAMVAFGDEALQSKEVLAAYATGLDVGCGIMAQAFCEGKVDIEDVKQRVESKLRGESSN